MSALQGREKAAPKALRLYSLHRAGERAKGAILSRERMAPFRSPKRTQGALPLDPAHWQPQSQRAARAAQSGAVYMASPRIFCESWQLATAPYYREARVTLPRRQTACGMQHCCARRIDECSGRRKLVCTTARQAERQRIVGAEASRLAALNAAPPRAGIPTPEA